MQNKKLHKHSLKRQNSNKKKNPFDLISVERNASLRIILCANKIELRTESKKSL
jgi:hypothetical protein